MIEHLSTWLGYAVLLICAVAAVGALIALAIDRWARALAGASVVVDAVRWRSAVKNGYLQEPRVVSKGLTPEADVADAQVTAALIFLAHHGLPTEVQELLVRGDPERVVPPNLLKRVLTEVQPCA